nr:DnaB-like helicase C-terminal domain-containing protein [Succinivibrio sp.]
RSLEVGEISRSLKALAKELDVPIMALSQLNREVEGRRDHRPVNSDLRESGSLEQDADVILFIDRNVKSKKKEDESYTLDDNKATLIVSKNRHGGTGDIPLLFQGAYTAFYDAQNPDADPELPPLPEYN